MPAPKKKAKDSWKKLGMALARAATWKQFDNMMLLYHRESDSLIRRARALRKAAKRGRG